MSQFRNKILLAALVAFGALVGYYAAYRYTYRTGGFIPYLNRTFGQQFHCSFNWLDSAFAPARFVDELPRRTHWRRKIVGTWRAVSPEFGTVELQLDTGDHDSLRVIHAINCPFFAPGDYPVSFPSVPIIENAAFYRNFTRLDDKHLWIDVLSDPLGWKEAKPFEFVKVE